MQMQAILSNGKYPEHSTVTVPFPIPEQEYDHILDLLRPLGIGDAVQRDCHLDELDFGCSALTCLEGQAVNLDELDYLAKRLDSFNNYEAAQFQATLSKLGLSDMTDIINLTFCCQQATVITDFSDLEKIGRQHFLTLYIVLGKDTMCGLFNPWSGGGSVLEIQLEKDVRIPIRYIWSALPDGYNHGQYDVGSVYGMCGSAWQDTLVKLNMPKNIIELEAKAA